jgi:hypothetical protein
MRADSAAAARSWDGRTAISSGKPSNFLGTELGPKIFLRRNGHINLAKRGEMVWLARSPIMGRAGSDANAKSTRALG